MRISQLLATRGIHYLATRFGWHWLRSVAFDEKYRRGDWRFDTDGGRELTAVLDRYLRKGDILVLGCGGASILKELEAEAFHSALGIDLSEEAIHLASRFASDKIAFLVADMETFKCPQPFDVILFSDSLYYVASVRQVQLLRRLARDLKPGGALVATFAEARRYQSILERIRRNFSVLEECSFSGSDRHVIAFR